MRYLLLVIFLSACATAEERAARSVATYGPYCERLGFQPNSNQWRECIQRERADRTARAGVAAQNAANVREAMRPR